MKPRTIFALVAILLVFAAYWLTRPKHHAPARPEWTATSQFITSADSVQTIATTYSEMPYQRFPADPDAYLRQKAPNEKRAIQTCDPQQRERLLESLSSVLDSEAGSASCFCPHHFVVATKGSQKLVIAICYFCSTMSVDGAIKMNTSITHDSLSTASDAFGIDLTQDLKDAKCPYNDGSEN